MTAPIRSRTLAVAAALVVACLTAALEAHGVSGKNATFVQSIQGPAIGPFLYLGAKHMVTGYDHLMFLVGVIFFLYRAKDVVQYVSLFTLGHSITLLAGVLGGEQRDAVAEREQAHILHNVLGAIEKEDHADEKHQVVVAGDHVLRAEIEKRPDRGPLDALKECRVLARDLSLIHI